MPKKRLIHEAIAEVLKTATEPMEPELIYGEIVGRGLYTFPAKDPVHVVRATLRRHCVNLDFPSARRTKYFSVSGDGRYTALPQPVVVEATAFRVKAEGRRRVERIVSVPSDDTLSAIDIANDTH